MSTKTTPTLTDIAARISAHLTRFERDPKINPLDKQYGTYQYRSAGAYRAGRYVNVRYVSYQGDTTLTREVAMRYLAWLDAGNVGSHFKMEQEEQDAANVVLAKMRAEATPITAASLAERADISKRDAAAVLIKAGFRVSQIDYDG